MQEARKVITLTNMVSIPSLGGLGRDGLGVGSDDDPSNPNNNHEAGPSSGGAPTAGRLL